MINGLFTDQVGVEVEAGLPNITGGWGCGGNNVSGAFSISTNWGYYVSDRPGTFCPQGYISFNASKCSNIYGKSDTVQPASIKVFMWRRVS